MPSPDHRDPAAPPSLADAQQGARRALDAKAEQAGASSDSPNPKHEERYSYEFDWTDKRGRRWQGSFTNEIASIYGRRLIGLTRARALGGTPFASIDRDTDLLIHMMAWMQTTLVEKPSWFADPDKLKSERLIAEVFKEVASHEATFFGLDEAEKSGAEAG